jgi:biotin operon repressor
MNNNYKDSIEKYIHETLGFNVYIEKLSDVYLKAIPLYLKYSDSYYLLTLDGCRFILSFNKDNVPKTALQLKKQALSILKNTGVKVIFGMEKQSSLLRKRMIQEKINFIVPGSRLYLPELLIDLKEIIPCPRYFPDFLSPSTQFLLLYHLEVEYLDSFSFKEIAEKLCYSPKTISKVAEELKAKDFCKVTGTKEKRFLFGMSRKQLWKMIEPYMQSPIYKVFYTNPTEEVSFCLAGNSALSYYTTLSLTGKTTYAIYYLKFDQIMKSKHWDFLDEVEGDERIEVWRYNPHLLNMNGHIDLLSLYLCYRDGGDDRIKLEIRELIQKKNW